MAKVTITGTRELERRLRTLGPRVARRVVRRAVKEATDIFEGAIETGAAAARDTGKFQASAGSRIRSYKGQTVVGVAGFRVFGLAGKKGKYPSNIDHLVEFGHRVVVGGTAQRHAGKAGKSKSTGERGEGRVVATVEPNPIVRKAFDANLGRVQTVLNTAIARGIEREAARLGRNG